MQGDPRLEGSNARLPTSHMYSLTVLQREVFVLASISKTYANCAGDIILQALYTV